MKTNNPIDQWLNVLFERHFRRCRRYHCSSYSAVIRCVPLWFANGMQKLREEKLIITENEKKAQKDLYCEIRELSAMSKNFQLPKEINEKIASIENRL